MAIISL